MIFAYDDGFHPAAPVLPLRLRAGTAWLRLRALVDTGADVTTLPANLASSHLPLVGTFAIRGVTGDAEAAGMYLVEIEIAGIRRRAKVAGFGEEAIVGRDLLNEMRLTLDGPARRTRVVVPR